MSRAWLYALFFFSGASALIYELVWQRLLHLVFGVSTLAVSAVLAAFMGGLALGGLLFGRLADQTRRPAHFYAILEVGIGLSALLVPFAFNQVTTIYVTLHHWLAPGLWAGTLLRFVMALLVLIVPATLIGGTVPFMARLALRQPRAVAGTFSLLYGINTLGAVIGAALTGFLLLRDWGMHRTLWLAAGLNGLVALGTLKLRNPGFPVPEIEQPSKSRPSLPSLVPLLPLLIAICTGAITTGLEVVWMRLLGIFTSNSAYAFALVLTVLLLGLSLGSLLQAFWSRRPGDGWRRLTLCQLLLAGLLVATLPYLRTTPEWLQGWSDGTSVRSLFLGELLLTVGILFLPALLIGMSFPLLAAAISGEDPQGFGCRLGRLYAINTIGCAVGAFASGFLSIPGLGIQSTIGLLFAGTLGVALIAWSQVHWPGVSVRLLVGTVILLGGAFAWHKLPEGQFLKGRIELPRQLVYYREGDNATVSVVQESDSVRQILVDGQPVAGTSATSVVDQKMLAHLPLLLHPAPQRALTVGFGSGGTSHSMILHGIDVDCVEIERAVPAAAEHFISENHGIQSRSHFRLIIDDARSWLRVAPVRYDAIVTDCTNIQYKSNGDLYTVEYFHLMKDRLTANGIAATWVPANGISGADLKTLIRSFHRVFPHTSIWHMNCLPTDFLIVVGTPTSLDLDLENLRSRMAIPAIHRDLDTIGLADPCRLLYTFLLGEEALDAYLADGPLHTDDRPVLSYTTYGASYRSTIADNLLDLLALRQDVACFVRSPADRIQLLRYYAASNETLLGHLAYLRGEAGEALRHYVEASNLLPSDGSLKHLVFTVYRRLQDRERATGS